MSKEEKLTFPIAVSAIAVDQPLGRFYVTKLSARLLQRVSFSSQLRVAPERKRNWLNPFSGGQRGLNPMRARQIGGYINTAEAAFPNSLILAANYTDDDILLEDIHLRWRVEGEEGNGCVTLVIPTEERVVSIIDGQHRLGGFSFAREDRMNTELLCAVYLDLPTPYQAYLFATINFNQKKVDKSQAYDLFGVGLEDEEPMSWSPDKLAVFLCRKLNLDETSPFRHHIRVAAKNAEILFDDVSSRDEFKVSTASIVDNILRLISTNPKADRDKMHEVLVKDGRSRSVLSADNSPLRGYYLNNNDLAIYEIIKNFFSVVDEVLWSQSEERSYIIKTIGIQALFDVLRGALEKISGFALKGKDDVAEFIKPAAGIKYSDNFFQASGQGRTRVRRVIQLKLGLIGLHDIEKDTSPIDLQEYIRLIS